MVDMTAPTTTNPEPLLPPGFRFHPTDEELILHYLRNRASAIPCPVSIIAEVDIYKFDPWELPAKASFGDREWYFFSPRDRKYPNGVRPNRAAASGYWKATGTDKPILVSGGAAGRKESIGVKKALVFYRGKPPKGSKTNWIMHEYRLPESGGGNNGPSAPARRMLEQHQQFFSGNKQGKVLPLKDTSSASMRLDDWVLCRIYEKSINNHNNNNGNNAHHHQQYSAGSTRDADRAAADGDLDNEDDSSNSYMPSPVEYQTTNNTTPSKLDHENFYSTLPKVASLSDLLAETDFSVLSRLLYDTPPLDVIPGQLPHHLMADPSRRTPQPAAPNQQLVNTHSVNAPAANTTLTNKRQLVWPQTGSSPQEHPESKKQRHAAPTAVTGHVIARPSAYASVMNACSSFAASSACNNLTGAGGRFANAASATGAYPLLFNAAPCPPQYDLMMNNAANQPFMMNHLHQQYKQTSQFLNADSNGSLKLH